MNEIVITESEAQDIIDIINDVIDELRHAETYPLDLGGHLFDSTEEELGFLREKFSNVISHPHLNGNSVIFESTYGKFKIVILDW